MFVLILMAMLFIFLLWMKVRELNNRVDTFRQLVKSMETHISELARKVKSLSVEAAGAPDQGPAAYESASSIPPAEEPPREKEAVPEPQTPLPEMKPSVPGGAPVTGKIPLGWSPTAPVEKETSPVPQPPAPEKIPSAQGDAPAPGKIPLGWSPASSVDKETASGTPPPVPEKKPPVSGSGTVSAKIPPARVPTPSFSSPPPSGNRPKFDWESLVGVKLFSWIAGVALLLAAIFFLQYSFRVGWLTPPVQMAIGILVGIGLLVVCELRAARKYLITANAMDASAIAILFATFYAAHARWELIESSVAAFVLMALVMAVAVLLSIRRDSLFIALLGLVGAFATPALLSLASEPVPLFSYILILNAGLAWVSVKKKWPLLTTLTLVFTFLYQWGWVFRFLTAGKLPLAMGIFLVFPILTFIVLAMGRKESRGESWISLHGQTANLSALLPLLFGLYIAAVPEYGYRYVLLFGFLLLMNLGLYAIAVARGPEMLHFFGGLSTIVITAIWFASSYESRAWPGILIFILLFACLYLAAPLGAKRFGKAFADIGKLAVYAVPLILFTFPVLAVIEPACAAPGLLFGGLFLILLGASAYALYAEEGPVYFIAALFALLAEACWASQHLDAAHLYSGLALFGIFGLFYIGVPVAARRWKRQLLPESGAAGLLLISLVLLLYLASGPIAAVAIWGLALLLLVLNAGLFLHGSATRMPMLSIIGVVISWIILGVLWANVSLAAFLLPALAVMAGFVLLVLAGNLWTRKRAPGSEADLAENGFYLGLAGHVFLLVVAARHSLSIPPWPFLGILLLLDLALGAVALYARRQRLHLAAMVASGLLLMVWAGHAGAAPWPRIGILSAGVLALFSIFWIYLAERAGMDGKPFSITAAITVLLAQCVAVISAMQSGSPDVVFLVAAHAIFLTAVFGLEWLRERYTFAVISLLPSTIAVTSWMLVHSGSRYWPAQLLFASIVYLMFVIYPLLLGRRSGRALGPYLAAVLAGIPFFFQARHCIIQAGWEDAIGILPIAQALLMTLLMVRLLGIEKRGERTMGRLALVAGAGLAFITVAIPLQLEREWIIIAWALEGAALAWLFGKIPHKGLLLAASGLFYVVFLWLIFSPMVMSLQRGGSAILNWHLYTYLVSSAALMMGGRFLAKTGENLAGAFRYLPKLLLMGGVLLLFWLLNIEVADFYSTGSTVTFQFTASWQQDMTFTLAWALFAVALLIAGIAIRSQPARIASLSLLVVTILKCFIHDLAWLGGLARVFSFVGLALCLALVALALQKYVLSARKEER